MPHFPVKLANDKYVLWSTVVDAPISCVQSADEMHAYLEAEGYWCVDKFYPDVHGYDWDRDVRAWCDNSVLNWNRAGEGERSIHVEEILERYKKP